MKYQQELFKHIYKYYATECINFEHFGVGQIPYGLRLAVTAEEQSFD